MGTTRWAAVIAVWAAIASGTAAAATYDSTITATGYFDFVFVPLEQHQAYELMVSAPGDIVTAAGELEWIGNRQAYREDGSYDFVNSQNVNLLTPISLTLNGSTITSAFVSTGAYEVYWPNGTIKYQFTPIVAENSHVSLFIRARVDPVWAGDHVTLSVEAVPEPATWALMVAGFGFAGGALRRRVSHAA